MVSLASIVAFYTGFSIMHYAGRFKYPEQHVSAIIDALTRLVSLGFSYWYVTISWGKFDKVENETAIYLIYVEAIIAYHTCSLIMVRSKALINVSRLIAIFIWLLILEEPRITWYGAIGALNDITFIFHLVLYLLRHFDGDDSTLYKILRGIRAVLLVIVRASLLALTLYKSLVYGLPPIGTEHLSILIFGSLATIIQSVIIVIYDIIYFVKLAKHND
jgi:hypothetical protein